LRKIIPGTGHPRSGRRGHRGAFVGLVEHITQGNILLQVLVDVEIQEEVGVKFGIGGAIVADAFVVGRKEEEPLPQEMSMEASRVCMGW
jgi:hypothetical protein